ncbi:MAG TPA: NYN domain-containing protein [Chloroflexota bacterium]|nr:NYN domain-containing protein [Chloroflexota bacterium]
MPRDEENYVGLFIDWDNLAISTAVDFAGAVPDVRAIVKAVQRFGTILIARAYAEWNVSSDRLSVYRAGIEPIFAPTFRFESDPGGAAPRGKSLADPCLVADCIDTLHLMPNINVFVLVSGDKDLIPIVRLVQLRGRRVVVIGPDFVAAILREMADEYIPYRLLAETSENPPTEVSVHGVRGHRRVNTPSRANALPTVAAVAPARPVNAGSRGGTATPTMTPSPVPTSVPVPPVTSAASVEPNGVDHSEPAVVSEPPAKAPPIEEVLDSAPLFTTISNILREREEGGKPRLRATNLKDQLLARIRDFNEKKYGFPRFKDLLNAAEKAGVLTVSRTGPVQWVTSTSHAPAVVTPVAVPPIETNGASESVLSEPPEPPAVIEASTVPATDTGSVDREVVRFMLGLRSRSRWLTYTYVLTNLLNHIGSGAGDAASDAEARATLNRLVQEGVLVADREPREIDVSGTRHRVRLCHIVDEHPLVREVLTELEAEAALVPTEAEATGPTTEPTWPSIEPPPVEPTPPELTVTATPAEPVEEVAIPTAAEAPLIEAPVIEAPVVPESTPSESVTAVSEEAASEAEPATVVAETPSPLWGEAEVPIQSLPSEPAAIELPVESAEPTTEEESPVADVAATAGGPSEAGEPAEPGGQMLSLADSFDILREVVRDATDANRPTTGPAAVKNRLVRRLGSFDEHTFGFSKFKDYLLAAERAGAVRLEISGNTTRVAPSEQTVQE